MAVGREKEEMLIRVPTSIVTTTPGASIVGREQRREGRECGVRTLAVRRLYGRQRQDVSFRTFSSEENRLDDATRESTGAAQVYVHAPRTGEEKEGEREEGKEQEEWKEREKERERPPLLRIDKSSRKGNS